MIGSWQNAFNIQGFTISDSELMLGVFGSSGFREVIELGFGAGGIEALGIGTTITIGTETAKYGVTSQRLLTQL